MNQIGALKTIIKLFNKAGLPYMISGAYAVSYYGEPRATRDLDIVVEISWPDIEKVCKVFSKGFEMDKEMMENAIRYHTHFTVIHVKSDFRIDFWVLKDRSFEKAKFNRRKRATLFGIRTYIISPEDIVLTKLEWYARSKNSKHLDDAVGIIRVQDKKLDKEYVDKVASELGIIKYLTFKP